MANNNKKPWYEKVNVWVTIVAGMCTFLGINIFGGKSLFKNNDGNSSVTNYKDNKIEIGEQSPIFTGNGDNKVIYNNYYTDIASETISLPEEDIIETKEIPQFNFGQALQHIYSNEDTIKEEILYNKDNKPINSSIYPGVSYWYISTKVRLITVPNGFRNHECSRTYYFDENENLTFALICDDNGEHRLFFNNDILIRYIDENGQNHDITQDLNDYECKWSNLALAESYEIFIGVKKPSVLNDFSVVASYDMNTAQSSISGIDVLIKAKTSFPADHVTISGISDENLLEPTDMHGGAYEWYFIANFYIKGTYTVTVTAYNSDGESVSDSFEYTY